MVSQEFSQNIHISGWSLLYLACVFIALFLIKADGVFNPAPTLTLTQSINLACCSNRLRIFVPTPLPNHLGWTYSCVAGTGVSVALHTSKSNNLFSSQRSIDSNPHLSIDDRSMELLG